MGAVGPEERVRPGPDHEETPPCRRPRHLGAFRGRNTGPFRVQSSVRVETKVRHGNRPDLGGEKRQGRPMGPLVI